MMDFNGFLMDFKFWGAAPGGFFENPTFFLRFWVCFSEFWGSLGTLAPTIGALAPFWGYRFVRFFFPSKIGTVRLAPGGQVHKVSKLGFRPT